MNTEYYINQILICTKNLYFPSELNPSFMKYKKYKIIGFRTHNNNNNPILINEFNQEHSIGGEYWGKWFIGRKEYRHKKFEKILK